MKKQFCLKRTLCIYLSICMLSITSLLSQAPRSLNNQAVACNNSGAILPSQNISIRYTITDGNAGSVVYQETYNTTTNQFGLLTLDVGNSQSRRFYFESANFQISTFIHSYILLTTC